MNENKACCSRLNADDEMSKSTVNKKSKMTASLTKAELNEKIEKQKNKIKLLNQKNRRKDNKIKSLSSIVNDLKEKQLLSADSTRKL